MDLWIGRAIVEDQLYRLDPWSKCRYCERQLRVKGYEKRRMLTLVGRRRQVGCCPDGCRESREHPLDEALRINAYQQARRLGYLLCVFLPFELSSWLLRQLTELFESDTLWSSVQAQGQQTMADISQHLARLPVGRNLK